MNREGNFLQRHALVIGIILMFLFTWPIDLSNSGLMPFKVPFIGRSPSRCRLEGRVAD